MRISYRILHRNLVGYSPARWGAGTRLRLSVRILPSSTVPGDLDFIKILCFLAAGWVSYHDDYSILRNEPRVTSVGMSGHTTPERFGRLGPPGSAAFPEFRLGNSGPERSRSRFDAAETPKRIPEDPNRSLSQPKPLRALETGPQGARCRGTFFFFLFVVPTRGRSAAYKSSSEASASRDVTADVSSLPMSRYTLYADERHWPARRS